VEIVKVKAIRTDSWLGIELGKIYYAETINGGISGRLKVHTDGYTVIFNEDDFELVNE
jgi:hypothetical protein